MSVVCLIVATRSRGPPASQPVIKEMPVSIASGTSYVNIGAISYSWKKKKKFAIPNHYEAVKGYRTSLKAIVAKRKPAASRNLTNVTCCVASQLNFINGFNVINIGVALKHLSLAYGNKTNYGPGICVKSGHFGGEMLRHS